MSFLTTLALLFIGTEENPAEKYEEYQPKATKIYVETGGDEIIDINNNEKVPLSWLINFMIIKFYQKFLIF